MRLIIALFILSCFPILGQNTTDKLGRKQGVWVKYWDKSETIPQYKGEFIDGTPVGQFWYYYPSGEVRAIIEHLNKSQSYVTYYFKNEEVMSEGMYLDKKRDSIWINYNQSGHTVSMEKYKEGKLNGKKLTFYLQNQIDRGEIKVLSETYYLDSLKSGPHRELFSSGKVRLSGQYLKDLPHGLWRKFDAEGRCTQSFRFKNGLKHGWVINYGQNKEIIHKELYNNGELLKGKARVAYLKECEIKGIDPNE
ncbi:MAG: toxin-antitoxin system YwqK family antitoxin [Crocinitomicaceae bacterium]|jgi:antitoxin component YwqK of YwqJK toxin-antitoxin module